MNEGRLPLSRSPGSTATTFGRNRPREDAMKNALMAHVENKHLKATPPQFDIGDIVDVHQRIVEGDKERIQIFSGTVIFRKGDGINATFTVRRIVNNEGVERIFPIHSPKIEKLEVKPQEPECAGRSCTTCVNVPVRRPG